MDIRQLTYFMAIAEEGSITAAAHKLHISQPPLSMQLKQLEKELGIQLVERGPRSITLTEGGKLLYRRARNIVELNNATKKELIQLGNEFKETLSLGMISSSCYTLFHKYLRQFQLENPQIHFELFEGNTFELIEKLRMETIELSMVRTPFPTDGFSHILLEPEPMAAVALPEFFSNLPEASLSLEALREKPLVYYRRFEALILSEFQKQGIHPITLCVNDDARTCLMWALNGFGVALVPYSVSLIAGRANLVRKPIENPNLTTQLGAIWKKNRQLTTAARSFVELFGRL